MKRVCLLILLVALLAAPARAAHAQDGSPWAEILNPDGSVKWENLVDLGNTSTPAEWMDVTLPGGIVVHQNATYHRYLTPSGNVLVLPDPATLFFMAMNPQASGLTGAQSMLGNGAAILMTLIGGALTPEQLAQMASHGYTDPKQFFQAVIDGKENIWSFVNFQFLGELLRMAHESNFLINALLLYLNGQANCAAVPGGCEGLPQGCPDGDCLPPVSQCPGPTIVQNRPVLEIEKTAPDYPLVVGQDPARRGADIRLAVSIPPVVLTWYEEHQDQPTCAVEPSREGGGCPGPADRYGNAWDPSMEGNPAYRVEGGEVHCIRHVEILPERIIDLRASAQLNPDSRAWILDDLAGKYYQAFVHEPAFNLVPGMAQPAGGCDGDQVCWAQASAVQVPFADPGTFDLNLRVYTAGTSFIWNGMLIPVTQPRMLQQKNTARVYVTLLSLIPAGAP
jgi:hypothetical protein